ncbi:MAG: hypothetical protein QOI66_4190 [Myxococcales bacterium]|nr:hypothetical protein [Myxococcales bacterium]
MSAPLSRRALLRGAGAAVALPLLDAMELLPGRRAAAGGPAPPARLAFLYLGTGWNTRQLFPKTPGPHHETTRILTPLEPLRGRFTLLQGMFLEFGGAHEGDHTFLTGSDAVFRPRSGKEYKNSISCDQVAAKALGASTRFPSLELSEERGTGFGGNGLSTLGWSQEGVPLAAENDPHAIFDNLFGADGPDRRQENQRRIRQRRSVLDGMRDTARELERTLGRGDRARLDQYLTSLREVEKELAREVAWSRTPKCRPSLQPGRAGDFGAPMHAGSPNFDYRTYGRLMYELIALAWQCDSTRVVTYVVRREGQNHYPGIEAITDYHSLTHHGGDPKRLDELARVDVIYLEQFAQFLLRLESIKEGDGTLLDRSLVGVSSGMGMGHSRNQLPTLLAGGGKLGIRHRGFVRYDSDVPLANLWATMLQRAGVGRPQPLPGSTGILRELT